MALRENLVIVWPNGMNDTKSGSGSWNVSSTFGSKGPICDLNRGNWPPPNECFESCPLCDESYSCDWTTCYDDIGFLEVVIETVKDQWCVDLDQMHMSGISNGGMLLWNIAAQGAKYLGVFSSRSLKTREKYISFAHLVLFSLYIFEESVFTFLILFLNDKLHNYVKKHTSLKKYTN